MKKNNIYLLLLCLAFHSTSAISKCERNGFEYSDGSIFNDLICVRGKWVKQQTKQNDKQQKPIIRGKKNEN